MGSPLNSISSEALYGPVSNDKDMAMPSYRLQQRPPHGREWREGGKAEIHGSPETPRVRVVVIIALGLCKWLLTRRASNGAV